MNQTYDIKRFLASRKHIRKFAAEYAERQNLNPRDVTRDIIQAKKANHISFMEYEWTGYYDMAPEQKKTVSTLWTRMEFRKKFTDRRYIGLLMNKYITSRVFAEFYRRQCVQASDVDAKLLGQMGGHTGRVVYKPNCKGMGQNIRILPVTTGEEIDAALAYIRKKGKGIVEEYICQDEVMNRLNPNAVSVVRIYSVSSPAGAYLFAPVLTVAHQKSISNGCRDALTCMVDIRTGKVLTDAVDQNKNTEYPAHPVTGVAFRGIELNYWPETIAMLRRAAALASRISNIGWDVAITEDGPVLIEANTIPGFTTAQYRGYHWITDGYGYQPLFDAVYGAAFQDDGRYERVILKLDEENQM